MPDPIVPAPGLSARTGPVVPVLARRGDYVPVVGGWLVISLPGEDVRSEVVEISSRDVLIVKLIGQVGVVRGGHSFKTGDLVAVQRAEAEGHLKETWVPIDEREVRMREEASRLAAAAVARAAEPAEAEPPPKRARQKKGAA